MNVTISPEAAGHLKSDLNGRILRIAFTTGCGGSGYRMGYAEEAAEGDVIINVDGLKIALDDMAATKLDGAVITYDSDDDGYFLDHPDALMTVWCG